MLDRAVRYKADRNFSSEVTKNLIKFAFAKKHIVSLTEPFAQHKFFPFLSPRKVAQAHTGKTKLRSQAS